jgi:glutamate synthase (NADPH/NADH) small chain
VIIGGGNTALDCVREALGLGIPQVTMAYRGDVAGMSGYAHEWSAALQDGALAAWRTQPVGFVSDGGRVTGVRCVRLDEDKKPIADTEHVIPADLVLLAIGQSKLGALAEALEGVVVERGCIVCDEDGATGRPGVYAGGDCRNGGKEVVNAVAHGRDAACAIHNSLSEGMD